MFLNRQAAKFAKKKGSDVSRPGLGQQAIEWCIHAALSSVISSCGVVAPARLVVKRAIYGGDQV